MSKTKFKYNPKTLSYEKVQRSLKERIFRGIVFVAPTIVLSLVFGLILSYNLPSLKEKALKKQVEELQMEFENVQNRVKLMDKVTEVIKKRDEELYRTTLGAKSFPEELRMMGVGGSDLYASIRNKKDGKLLTDTYTKLDEIERKLYAQSLSFKELTTLVKERENRLASMPAIQPVDQKNMSSVASGYGWRTDPIYGTKKMHWGIDFAAPKGTEIYATGDGVVEYTKVNRWGYGREVVVNHGFGYQTRYAHMSKFLVKTGDTVKRGQTIGLVGSTGKSTGSHLHYEVIKDGQHVHPVAYFHSDLTPEQYEQIIHASDNAFKSMD